MQKPTRLSMVLLASTGLLLSVGATRAAELGANTPYYEDDAWYDISEWMDGNDYNPTDEAWWRWDDEAYQASDDVATDSDSDLDYGYTAGNDNDWFYDYYTPSYSDYYTSADDGYISDTSYYDYDDDGLYDAYTTFTDWDADGIYEDYNYYAFSDAKPNSQQQQQQKQQQSAQQKSQQSKPMALTGTIDKVKQVKVRGAEHTVVSLKPQDQQQGKSLVADLGKSSDLQSLNLKQGDKLTIKGPKSQVGDKHVVMARSIEKDGQTTQINRQGKQMQGKVLNTHKTQIRGREHLIAMVEMQGQKQDQKAGKVAVDLGPSDKLNIDVSQGKSLTFTGVPVKVKDKRLVMARSIQSGDQMVQIDRQFGQEDKARTAGERTQGQQQNQQSQDQSSQQQQDRSRSRQNQQNQQQNPNSQ